MQVTTSGGARRAVVIGASMAGLLAARVLADHFDEVLIIERDRLPADAEGRKGVPQGRHVHALLIRGEQILERLFPGITATLIAGGATRIDLGSDLAWHHFGVWKRRFVSGLETTVMSRPFLEAEVRRRVLALPQVRYLDAHHVLGLRASKDAARVTGVRVQGRGEGDAEETRPADLVVDASGRGSATPRWLAALGFPRPEEDVITVHVGYATRTFRRTGPFARPWKALYVLGEPPHHARFGVLSPIEGGRWIASLSGMMRDYPSTELPQFLEFARSLPVGDLYRALLTLEPLDEGVSYRFVSNLRRRYERMARFPGGLVVLGDSLCSFNPIYGQGMTAAALAAQTLGECLKSDGDLDRLPGCFFARVAQVIDMPWQTTTLEDLRCPDVVGERPPGYALLAGLVARVHRATSSDERVALHFLRALQMIEPPTTLLRPDLLARALLRGGG